AQRDEFWILRLVLVHPARERVAQAFDDLEQRQVSVRRLLAVYPLRAGTLQDPFEVAEKLRYAALAKSRRALCSCGLLILVVLVQADRVMCVVHLRHEVGDRQLQLVRPEPPGFAFRREAMASAQKEQYVRS